MKNLKILFNCDNYTELAEILMITPRNVYVWKNHGIPSSVQGLLNLIEKQQKELIKLKEQE